MLIYQTEFEN